MTSFSRWAAGINLGELIQTGLFVLAALISIPMHESAHGLTALWLGDDTARRARRISLNPLRHIDPIGLVMMAVMHIGWAKGVPVDMRRFKNPKAGMALTAAAGPISNLLLGFLAAFAYCLSYLLAPTEVKLMWWGYEKAAGLTYYLIEFFYVLMLLNAGLAVFNLIPISPLDGSKILAIVLPKKYYGLLMRYERYGFLILIALSFSGILSKILLPLRNGVVDALLAAAEPLARMLA